MTNSQDTLTILAVGDVRPEKEPPEEIFALNRDMIKSADIAFGQLETPFSDRGSPHIGRGAVTKAPARNVGALSYAGFDVISFASNHALDWGYDAFHDTIAGLKKNNIGVVGVGENLDEARQPIIVEKKGTRVAFLAYNSVLMAWLRGYAADIDRPGCNPLRAYTFYEPVGYGYQPGTPGKAISFAYPDDKARMIEDIQRARQRADVVVVSQHAGLVHLHAAIAMYQKEIGKAAIDAGADVVFQHHAHMLKGIESYKGRIIFYGLGNFACENWAAKREIRWQNEIDQYYNFTLEPGWERYAYHPESRNTMAVEVLVSGKKVQQVSYIPCLVNQKAQAEILKRDDPRTAGVFQYVEELSTSQGLNVKFTWQDDKVVIS